MEKSLFIFLWSAIIAIATPLSSNDIIEQINAMNSTWKAGKNFDDVVNWKRLLGTIYYNTTYLPVLLHDERNQLPEQFDSRTKWSTCTSLNEIRDQGDCGSCWAFSTVEVMTDRICIHSQGEINFHFSAEDVLSCCEMCGDGCDGGIPVKAFEYWIKYGIVSGGNYNSNEGCRPYSIPHSTDSKKTPKCIKKCQETYNGTYETDKRFGKVVYTFENTNVTQIMQEILINGPVSASFMAFEDFSVYKEGVYQHLRGDFRGLHEIKIFGWGVEDGTPYWLCANSWGTDWGEKGFFKFLKGKNHCQIENSVIAALPKY